MPNYSAPSDDLIRRLGIIFAEWKAIPPTEQAAKSGPFSSRVDAELTGYVSGRLSASPRPSGPALQADVDKALALAEWESVFGVSPAAANEAWSSNPVKFGFVLQGNGDASELYAAGFAVGFGNSFSVFVHGFAPTQTGYRRIGVAGRDLDGSMPQAERIKSFGARELRILAWGLHIGSPEGLTSVVLYSFDGQHLRTVWARLSVPRATVTISGDRVVINSQEPLSRQEGTWKNRRETYEQTSEGLRLIEARSTTSR